MKIRGGERGRKKRRVRKLRGRKGHGAVRRNL